MRKKSLNMVYQLAKHDSRVVFIGSDLGPGVLSEMKNEMPERFFMEGVSEQHIIGMAAGLAMSGYIPYVNTIATFLTRRCYEQIAIDLCLQNLPVRLIASGGGGVYAPLGSTHVAIEDISLMRSLPNMTIICPCDAVEMELLMKETLEWKFPLYIRLAKGGDPIITENSTHLKIGKGVIKSKLNQGSGLFITTGIMTNIALEAIKILKDEGIDCGLLHLHTIKPLDHDTLKSMIEDAKVVIIAEEHLRNGGLGSAILEFVSDNFPHLTNKINRMGIEDKFPTQYGNQQSLLLYWGLTKENLYKEMKNKSGNI